MAVADLVALRRAAELLDRWAKDVGHDAMVNQTDPYADAGTKLWSVVLMSFAAKARADACDLRMRALIAEVSQPSGPDTKGESK